MGKEVKREVRVNKEEEYKFKKEKILQKNVCMGELVGVDKI